jgi:hypothetical protein
MQTQTNDSVEQAEGVATTTGDATPARPAVRRRYDAPRKYLLARLKHIDEEHADEEKYRGQVTLKNWMFYRGDHFGFVGRGGEWKRLIDTTGLHRFNQFGSIVDALAKEWAQSDPKIEVTARKGNDGAMVACAQVSQDVFDVVESGVWNEWFEQSMAKHAMLSRRYFIYTRPSKEVETESERVPLVAERNVKLPGTFLCGACGAAGREEQALSGGCPKCGAAPEIVGGFDEQVEVRAGYEEINCAGLVSEIVDPAECKYDLSARGGFENSDYFRRVRRTKRYRVENMYPAYAGGAAVENSREEFPTLENQQRLERAAGTGGYDGGDRGSVASTEDEIVFFKEYWLLPDYYRNYRAPVSETVGGVTLEADEGYIDKFPDGMCVVMCGDDILEICGESKNSRWTGGVYKIDPTSSDGKGLEDLIDIQEMQNEVVSLIFEHLMRNASPPTIIDEQLINGDDFTGDPGTIAYTRKGFTRQRPISDFIYQMFGKQLGSDVFSFFEGTQAGMKSSAQVWDSMSGGPVQGTDTFQGLALLRETSTSTLLPALAIKAWVKTQWAYQVLELVQKFWSKSQFLQLDKDWGESGYEWFMQCNVRRDLKISYKDGSHIPRTSLEKLSNILAFMEKGGGDPNIPIKLKVMLARALGVDYEVETFSNDLRIAKLRLEKMKKGVGFYAARGVGLTEVEGEIVPDMRLVLAVSKLAPVQVRSDEHTIHIDFYIDQLKALEDNEDAVETQLLRAVLEQKIKEHDVAMVERQQEMNAMTVAANAPVAAAQADAENAKAEQGAQMKEREMQTKAGLEAEKKAADSTPAPPVSAPPLPKAA